MDAQDDSEELKPGTGLYCFLNSERECGPDCMAYQAVPVEGPDYMTPDGHRQQWAACMLLVHAHRTSKHLVLMTNLAKAAEARKQPMPQLPVFGKVPT